MTSITGTLHPELYAAWRPALRGAGLAACAVAGAALWAHATIHPEASWYVTSEGSYADGYQLAGVMLVVVAVMASIVLLLMPWQARKSIENRIEISIKSNGLSAVGRGRHSGIDQRRLAADDRAFSSDQNLVESPKSLNEEVTALLQSLGLRLKPFVLIKVEGDASPSELTVIQQVFHQNDNVLDYRMVGPTHHKENQNDQ